MVHMQFVWKKSYDNSSIEDIKPPFFILEGRIFNSNLED